MDKIIEINNTFKTKIKKLNNNLQKLTITLNTNNQYNQNTKNIAIKEISVEYNKKIQELKNQYNIDSYDIRYDAEFNENEIEDILKKLVKENVSHVKKWDCNQNVTSLPEYCGLIEIQNKYAKIVSCNKSANVCNIYDVRLMPFLKFLNSIDLTNVNTKFIVLYCDNIELSNIKKNIGIDIPILCSSVSNNCRKIYNNTILIPNMYYYGNYIPINEVKINDIEYKNKKKHMDFCGTQTNTKRLAFAIWCKNKNCSDISCNVSPSFGEKLKGYEKYYSEINVSIKEQLTCKFLVSMDGCSTAWNGIIWKLYSNSLVFKLNQEFYEYWYSLLNKTNIFQCNTFDEMYAIMKTIDENSNEVKEMHSNKKKLAKLIMNDDFNKKYLHEILLELTKMQNIDREITNTYDT